MIREMRIRNYSERTITNYISALIQLSKYYNLSPDQLTKEQVKEFAYYLINEKEASIPSINQLISAWKILQEDILGNQWEEFKIKRPRREKKLPQVLSQSEALALVEAPDYMKHRTILKLTYACGLRSMETLHLKLSDIDTSRKVVRVNKGKGNKSREVPLSESLIKDLREYYRFYRPAVYLFEGRITGKPYSSSSFQKIVKKAAIKVGIKKNPSPHVLRHCFATHMLDRGVNLKRVQLLLGHHSLKTTSVYLHLANSNDIDLPNILIAKD